MKILVMWSGGIDSTALLYHLLTQTDHEVHAHHIHIDNAERRNGAERVSIIHQYRWLVQNCRRFNYDESRISLDLTPLPADIEVAYFIAGTLARLQGFDAIAAGKCKDDDYAIKFDGGGERRDYGEKIAGDHWQRARNILQATVDDRKGLVYRTPFYDKPKREAAASLPPELLALCWSCRRPIYDGSTLGAYQPCNKCHACYDLAVNGLTHPTL